MSSNEKIFSVGKQSKLMYAAACSVSPDCASYFETQEELIRALEDKMLSAAGDLDFEKAARYRDELFQLQGKAPLEKEQPQPLHRRRSTRHPKVK